MKSNRASIVEEMVASKTKEAFSGQIYTLDICVLIYSFDQLRLLSQILLHCRQHVYDESDAVLTFLLQNLVHQHW